MVFIDLNFDIESDLKNTKYLFAYKISYSATNFSIYFMKVGFPFSKISFLENLSINSINFIFKFRNYVPKNKSLHKINR